MRRPGTLLMLPILALLAAGCSEPRPPGPADGHDLPPVDTGRVAIGDTAPDFTLFSRTAERVTLSDLYRERTIILVFYRGHW